MNRRLTAIHLARKTMPGTVAETALKYGTGSLNIEATRLPTEDDLNGGAYSEGGRASLPGDEREGASAGMFAEGGGRLPGQFKQPKGRWPANLILQHHPSCEGEILQSSSYPSSSGKVLFHASEQWTCAQGCPVADLEKQEPGSSAYFKQVADEVALAEYLRDLLSTPSEVAIVSGPATYAGLACLSGWQDDSVCGLVVRCPRKPTADEIAEFYRILKPGGHLALIAPLEQPTGHTGAILMEEAGFEIRDCILWVRGPGRLHYVAKANRKEREAGCAHLPGKAGHEAVDRKEGSAGVNNPRAGAGRTAGIVKNHHPCLHPDALVMTAQGYRPISGVQLGQMVYGKDGRFHPVEHVSHHPYTSEHLYEIAVKGTNYTTLASDNHPFLVWRPVRKGKSIVGGDVLWVEGQDLRKGDYTMTPILQEGDLGSPSREDWWWVFGLWLAEGVLQRAGHGTNVYPSFTLHEDEAGLLERLRRFFEERGKSFKVYPKKGSKAVQAIGFDPEIGEDFGRLSPCGASNKRLPQIIWSACRSLQEALFEGYMAGDGGKVRSYRQVKTVSPDLASQVRLLGEALGTKANLFKHKASGGSLGDRVFQTTLPTYQVRFYSRDMQNDRKPASPSRVQHNGVEYRLSYIQSVTPVPYEGDVWNLTVKDCPTFQTAVGMSHNTVKPIAVMVRLLADVPTDEGPVVEPFLGSGTTGIACLYTGHDFVGIEREAEYLRIADARVRYWDSTHHGWHGAEILSDQEDAAEEEEEPASLMDFLL